MSGRHRALRVLLSTLTTALALGAGCSSSGDGEDVPASTPVTADATSTASTAPTAPPRYSPGDDPRMVIDADDPLFLYNVYVGSDPTVIDRVVERWPDDLRRYLGFQVVFPSKPPMDEAERLGALDEFLERTDELGMPALVQTAAFTGETGPSVDEVATAFAEHDSLVGVAIAELSADYASSVAGLSATQRELIAAKLRSAAANGGMFLWADMGYFGPQVFVDAGADAELVALLREQSDRVVVQAKHNGSGRHFGSESAAVGLWQAGLARSWGVNSEDWLWWEASFERLFGPQVPGGLTAAGMTRSSSPNRARLTYPEALFGTEMLMAASSGASVFSIEAPARGTVDAEHDVVSPAGEHVVFPLLRRIVEQKLIPTTEQVLTRTPFVIRPAQRDAEALRTDAVYDALGGPDGCSDADRLTCTQRQWLWRTGPGVIVPTVPSAGPSLADRLGEVIAIDGPASVDALVQRLPADGSPAGSAWVGASARDDVWFVAHPEENADVVAPFALERTSGELGPHTFAVVEDGASARSVFVDNFRTDTTELWASAMTDEEVGGLRLDDVPVAAPGTTVLRFDDVDPAAEVLVEGTDDHAEERTGTTVVVTLRHRGPVTVSIRI